ncbi:MAG: hypothetical protein AAFR35_07730 [Pseudomonadota bacterium]
MIYYVATERHLQGTRRFLGANPAMKRVLQPFSYEELLVSKCGPVGHYIFTDFDRLTRYELDCVSAFRARLREIAPEAHQLNDPATVLDRYPMLVALHKAGINAFTATRIETGQHPPAYPVFIRSEDGCRGPETALIADGDAYDAALADLRAKGKARRGRIAIGYAAQVGPDGLFRKYGAYRIGGDILPHHVHFGRHWVVKRNAVGNDKALKTNDGAAGHAALVEEELAYVRDNPHQELLAKVFEIAGVEFGRVDYGIVDGRVAIYEINTNPKLPRFQRSDARNGIREITRPQMLGGFQTLNTRVSAPRRLVRFATPKPREHSFRWPRRTLPRALVRFVLA